MKKILLGILICGTTIAASAQVSDTTNRSTSSHKYYYYPKSNVYFDQASGNYWYLDNATSQWKKTTTAPTGVVLQKNNRHALNYTGTEPWKNNVADMKKYKATTDTTAK